jgi:hypothetical protein
MANFPSVQLPSARSRTVSKPQLRSDFESGSTQIRARGTRPKHKWTLTWEFIPKSDWELIHDHFVENSGSSFTVTKEMIYETTDRTVIYTTDELTAKSTPVKGYYSIELQFEEL